MQTEFAERLEGYINDTSTWHSFVELYRKLIYRSISKTLQTYNTTIKDPNEIDGIVHDVLIKLWRNKCRALKRLRKKDEKSFLSYLERMAVNGTIDYLRKRNHRSNSLGLLESESETAEDYLQNTFNKELRYVFGEVLEGLSEKQRYFFHLKHILDLDGGIIAEEMNIAPGYVDQLNHKIKRRLRKIIAERNLEAKLRQYLV